MRALRIALAAIACAAIAAGFGGIARAQDAASYPDRPIHLVVPYPPGALTDLLARAIAKNLGDELKQTVVVDNKPGAGTLIGADFVAKSAADGYTLLMATSTTLGISPALYKEPAIDPVRDFAAVSPVGYVNFILVGNTELPAKDLPALIDDIRRNAGKYNYASVGSGSPHHLFMEELKKRLGLDIQHVPYKGTGQAFPDLLSGKIQIMFADFTAAIPSVVAERVRAYGASSARPIKGALLPDIPPIATVVPGFDWQAWQGIVAPAKTPRVIVDKLNAVLQKMLHAPDFSEQFARFGMDPAPPQSVDAFAAFVKSEAARWAVIVKASGARVE